MFFAADGLEGGDAGGGELGEQGGESGGLAGLEPAADGGPGTVLARVEAGDPQLDRLLRGIGAEVVPVGEEQVALARDAALRFGRGRHPAALNFGDCFSYALAVARGEPLLFVGDDFSKTDVEVCRW